MSDLLFGKGSGYTRTAYNSLANGFSSFDGPPFPPGVLRLEVGSVVWPFTVSGGRADLSVSAADVAKVVDGTAWRLVWAPASGPVEVLDSGVTKTVVPCCGN